MTYRYFDVNIKKYFPALSQSILWPILYSNSTKLSDLAKDSLSETLGLNKLSNVNQDSAFLLAIGTDKKLDIDIKLIFPQSFHKLNDNKVVKAKAVNLGIAKFNLFINNSLREKHELIVSTAEVGQDKNFNEKAKTGKMPPRQVQNPGKDITKSKVGYKLIAFAFLILPVVTNFDVRLNINVFLNNVINLKLTNDVLLENWQDKLILLNDKKINKQRFTSSPVILNSLNSNSMSGKVEVNYRILQFKGEVTAIPQFSPLPGSIIAEHSLLIYRLTEVQQAYLLSKNIDVEYLYDR